MELDCERKVSLVGCELQVVSTETKAQRFETLVLGYRDRSIRLAWRLLGAHRGAAEDVTQQAFVKAWNGFDRFRDDAQLRTWFRRILVNQGLKASLLLPSKEFGKKSFGRPCRLTAVLAGLPAAAISLAIASPSASMKAPQAEVSDGVWLRKRATKAAVEATIQLES